MKNRYHIILSCLVFPAALCFTTACKKEHLQPNIPESAAEPLVYISAILDSDTVYFAGGVNSYVGEVSMTDTMNLRYFNFYLFSQLSSPAQPRPCFKIYINNARPDLGAPVEDLDTTVVAGAMYYQGYQYPFTPFAVTVDWFDSTGAQYSSALIPQFPQIDFFNITSVEDVSFGNKTYKKVTAEFHCTLMQANSFATISLTNGRATILFGAN
jgi:hypothetical protein